MVGSGESQRVRRAEKPVLSVHWKVGGSKQQAQGGPGVPRLGAGRERKEPREDWSCGARRRLLD